MSSKPMNTPMFDQFEFPAQSATKHSNVFDHYAAAQVPAFPAGQWQDIYTEQQFQPTPAMTISPAELLSTTSTVNNCFSDVDHTPLIEETDLSHNASTWAPLFSFEEIKQEEAAVLPQQQPDLLAQAQQQSEPVPQEVPSFAKALAAEVDRKLKRKETPLVAARAEPPHKVDKHGFTMYNRKPRQAPLQPVDLPDNADSATAKRARNTEAARRSRARKMERMTQLEERVHELSRLNEQLEAEVERLRRKCGE